MDQNIAEIAQDVAIAALVVTAAGALRTPDAPAAPATGPSAREQARRAALRKTSFVPSRNR